VRSAPSTVPRKQSANHDDDATGWAEYPVAAKWLGVAWIVLRIVYWAGTLYSSKERGMVGYNGVCFWMVQGLYGVWAPYLEEAHVKHCLLLGDKGEMMVCDSRASPRISAGSE